MSINIKRARAGDLYVGTRRVKEIYIKRRLGYSSGGAAVWTLFDAGYVEGVSWSANPLIRPNYTTYTAVNLGLVETDGIMVIGITGGSTSLSYNCHVATDKISIPSTATKLKVRARRVSGTQGIMKFGLLGDEYVNSCSGTGGTMSSNTYVGTAEADYSIDLPEGFAGSSAYRTVINIQDAGGTARNINITKVWFE